MRALVISSDEKNRAKELLAFAKEPENWYKPPFTKETAPGINENYVMYIPVGYRVVFSYTLNHEHLYKHLSVSVDTEEYKYPSPEAVVMIASLFDFSGASEDALRNFREWYHNNDKVYIRADEDEKCIVVIEEVSNATHHC